MLIGVRDVFLFYKALSSNDIYDPLLCLLLIFVVTGARTVRKFASHRIGQVTEINSVMMHAHARDIFPINLIDFLFASLN